MCSLWSQRDGVGPEYTINTGTEQYDQIDVVAKIEGKTDLGAWGDAECDRIDGHVGAIVAPAPFENKSRVQLYHSDLCRRLELDFKKELTVSGGLDWGTCE